MADDDEIMEPDDLEAEEADEDSTSPTSTRSTSKRTSSTRTSSTTTTTSSSPTTSSTRSPTRRTRTTRPQPARSASRSPPARTRTRTTTCSPPTTSRPTSTRSSRTAWSPPRTRPTRTTRSPRSAASRRPPAAQAGRRAAVPELLPARPPERADLPGGRRRLPAVQLRSGERRRHDRRSTASGDWSTLAVFAPIGLRGAAPTATVVQLAGSVSERAGGPLDRRAWPVTQDRARARALARASRARERRPRRRTRRGPAPTSRRRAAVVVLRASRSRRGGCRGRRPPRQSWTRRCSTRRRRSPTARATREPSPPTCPDADATADRRTTRAWRRIHVVAAAGRRCAPTSSTQIRAFEAAHRARRTILAKIEQLQDVVTVVSFEVRVRHGRRRRRARRCSRTRRATRLLDAAWRRGAARRAARGGRLGRRCSSADDVAGVGGDDRRRRRRLPRAALPEAPGGTGVVRQVYVAPGGARARASATRCSRERSRRSAPPGGTVDRVVRAARRPRHEEPVRAGRRDGPQDHRVEATAVAALGVTGDSVRRPREARAWTVGSTRSTPAVEASRLGRVGQRPVQFGARFSMNAVETLLECPPTHDRRERVVGHLLAASSSSSYAAASTTLRLAYTASGAASRRSSRRARSPRRPPARARRGG